MYFFRHCRAFIFLLMNLLPFFESGATTERTLWIPRATAPPLQECRFEMEQRHVLLKKSGDAPGQHSDYGFSGACNELQYWRMDFEVSVDYRSSSEMHTENLLEPIQLSGRATYGLREKQSWHLALGIDDFGFKPGETNANVIYLLMDHVSEPFSAEFGLYYGNPEVLKTETGEKSAFGAILGVWRQEGRNEYGVEYQGGQSRYGYLVMGTRVKFNETLTGTLGYGFANNRDSMRDWLLLRIELK